MALGDGIRRDIAKISIQSGPCFATPSRARYEQGLSRTALRSGTSRRTSTRTPTCPVSTCTAGPGSSRGTARSSTASSSSCARSTPTCRCTTGTGAPTRGARPAGERTSSRRLHGSAQGDAGAPFAIFESTEGGGHTHIWRAVNFGSSTLSSAPVSLSDATVVGSATWTTFNNSIQRSTATRTGSSAARSTQAHYSFHDPFVFLLHSNVDRLFAMWQTATGPPERLDPATSTAATRAPWPERTRRTLGGQPRQPVAAAAPVGAAGEPAGRARPTSTRRSCASLLRHAAERARSSRSRTRGATSLQRRARRGDHRPGRGLPRLRLRRRHVRGHGAAGSPVPRAHARRSRSPCHHALVPYTEARIWFGFTGGAAGRRPPEGTMTIHCVETGQDFVFDLTGNTIARPTVAVMLALDQSGSHGRPRRHLRRYRASRCSSEAAGRFGQRHPGGQRRRSDPVRHRCLPGRPTRRSPDWR